MKFTLKLHSNVAKSEENGVFVYATGLDCLSQLRGTVSTDPIV